MRHLYEISLSERELAAIIRCLRLAESEERKLATRLESELWTPYHEQVALGRNTR
jgi:hypothetical protein